MTDSISRSPGLLNTWITGSAGNKMQITQTLYDLPYTGWTGLVPPPVVQRNLRNRVSYTSFTTGHTPANYNQASFYAYDAHGNVDTLLQDFGNNMADTSVNNVMNQSGNEFKRIVYQYDLISGKVNSVAYQPNNPDQFYHRYSYDAENRLILAETSMDSVYWESDAQYQYYKHGPLARTVLGDQQVQGLDYAYTLQGWLKGINSTSLNAAIDMGNDGDSGSLNQYVARDAYGISLNYFTGDYSNINILALPFPGYSAYLDTINTTNYRPLYNGNISSMVTNIGKLNNPMFYNYKYDQLNRITRMDAFNNLDQVNNTWSGMDSMPDYRERIAYDANGNITNYLRNGFGANIPMDSLSYNYNRDINGNLLNNKLNYIHDQVSSSGYTSDLQNQSSGNYSYDSIGNLTSDVKESITNITWNVYGKITEIQRTSTTANPVTDIQYIYDAAGNRISKTVTGGSSAGTTWYVRDASGNVMAVYQKTDSLRMTEQHIYGSSRLGILNTSVNMVATPVTQAVINNYRGFRNYELSNHLGNVLVTISDKKFGIPLPGSSSLIDHFTADVVNANDYYPFGMQMPGRSFAAANGYRYGFNGKEQDPEVKGSGNQYDYGFRIYDPRAGRFLSVDPLSKNYPWYTPYQFSGNKPIWAKDVDGLEENTMSTYVYHAPVLAFKPSFKGIISITDATSEIAHKTFEGNFGQLAKADPSKHSIGIVNALVGNNVGTNTGRLDVTLTGKRSGDSKTWKGTDINYFTQYSYSFTSNNVTEIGTFELQNGTIQTSARIWDPLAFLLVNKVVNSIVGLGAGALRLGAATSDNEMITLL